MAEAEDHLVAYESFDEDGSTDALIYGHIYQEAPFAGLW